MIDDLSKILLFTPKLSLVSQSDTQTMGPEFIITATLHRVNGPET